jgi:hypothetical protein
MKPIDEILALYFRAWNEPTLDGCARLLAECGAPRLGYFDPKYTCHTIDELAARILESRKEAPSFRVDVTTAIDGYDDTFRYGWVFVVSESVRIPGLDVVVRGKDGKIASITSFFGTLAPVPAGTAPRVQPRWAM